MATAAPRRGASASRAAAERARKSQRRSFWTYAIVALAAIATVSVLVAFQLTAGGSSTVPPRIATGDGRVLGDPDAPVTVIEYADFQCPVCKRAESDIISRIEEEYVLDGHVKVEFRMFPFLGQESWDAAQAAEAAREQGKFWEYHNALFNSQGRENGGAYSYDNLVAIAGEVGLDVARFEETLTSNVYLDPIQQEKDEALAANVNSTPTFYVGDQKIVGAQDYDVFRDAIESALADAEAAESESAQ